MNIINSFIGSMNKEEIRHFKVYLNRTRTETQRKDVALFDFIRKQYPEYHEDAIMQTLYGKGDKNSLYRLKNRLLDDLGKSITLQHFDANETNQIMHCLALARLFLQKAQADVAHYYLKKAEKRAKAIESNELLDIVYSEFIQLSHEKMEINPETYINKRRENRIQLNKLQEMDDILAAVTYRLKISQNYATANTEILSLLKKTVSDFSGSNEVSSNTQLRFRIYHSVSKLLLQQKDYLALEKYLLSAYKKFSFHKLFNRNNHDVKLDMLRYIVNALFKNGKYEQSLKYCDLFYNVLLEHNRIHHDKYLIYYYLGLVPNYIALDKDKALETLLQAKGNSLIQKNPDYYLGIMANLAICYYERKEFRQASRQIAKFRLHNHFNILDEAVQLKFRIVELMIRFELSDFEFIERQIAQIKKDMGRIFKREECKRDLQFFRLLENLAESPKDVRRNQKSLNSLKTFLEIFPDEEASEQDIIHYNDWLRSKIGILKKKIG